MNIDMSMDMKKERIRELNHRQKVKFSTLLLPALVVWNTLNTRGSTASHHHIEILKSCNSYHSMLFALTLTTVCSCCSNTLMPGDYYSFAMVILSHIHGGIIIAESISVSIKVVITCTKEFFS